MINCYFDLGNTRIKYWVPDIDAGKGAFSYSDPDPALQRLRALVPQAHTAVFASVVKDQRHGDFVAALRRNGFRIVRECVVTATALNVECAYADVTRLGVDRWLAVLGAWTSVGKSCLVVDLGTAVTLDFINHQGRHLGGYILPGLRLGIGGLLQGTSNVRVDGDILSRASTAPGCNTTDAVYHGALFTFVAVIEQAFLRLQQQEPAAKLLITGGDAALVGNHLGCHYQIREDLVFEGMRQLADHGLVVDVPPAG